MFITVNNEELKEIKEALSITVTHYYRCMNVSRLKEEDIDIQNARRVVNEAAFQEFGNVVQTFQWLQNKLKEENNG